MKKYVKPSIEKVQIMPDEAIANPFSGCNPHKYQNNGWGNGDQDPPGNSGPHNGAENNDW